RPPHATSAASWARLDITARHGSEAGAFPLGTGARTEEPGIGMIPGSLAIVTRRSGPWRRGTSVAAEMRPAAADVELHPHGYLPPVLGEVLTGVERDVPDEPAPVPSLDDQVPAVRMRPEGDDV